MFLLFDQPCLNERLQPNYTHSHTHTDIYIYIYIYGCVCVCVRAGKYVCVFSGSQKTLLLFLPPMVDIVLSVSIPTYSVTSLGYGVQCVGPRNFCYTSLTGRDVKLCQLDFLSMAVFFINLFLCAWETIAYNATESTKSALCLLSISALKNLL